MRQSAPLIIRENHAFFETRGEEREEGGRREKMSQPAARLPACLHCLREERREEGEPACPRSPGQLPQARPGLRVREGEG